MIEITDIVQEEGITDIILDFKGDDNYEDPRFVYYQKHRECVICKQITKLNYCSLEMCNKYHSKVFAIDEEKNKLKEERKKSGFFKRIKLTLQINAYTMKQKYLYRKYKTDYRLSLCKNPISFLFKSIYLTIKFIVGIFLLHWLNPIKRGGKSISYKKCFLIFIINCSYIILFSVFCHFSAMAITALIIATLCLSDIQYEIKKQGLKEPIYNIRDYLKERGELEPDSEYDSSDEESDSESEEESDD